MGSGGGGGGGIVHEMGSEEGMGVEELSLNTS